MNRAEILSIVDGTHPRIGRTVAYALYALILISATAIAVETMPDLAPGAQRALRWLEATILAIFALEYAVRVSCSPRPLAYVFSFWGIIDFIAIVPAILFLFPDLASVRALRLLRLARLLKLLNAGKALDRIGNAFVKNRAELAIFTFIAAVVLYLAAVGIYHLEHEAQPEAFGSIPASLWWAIATLTTVGYGDVYPVTALGRLFTGVVILIGIGIVAVPAGLVTSALLEDDAKSETADTNREDST